MFKQAIVAFTMFYSVSCIAEVVLSTSHHPPYQYQTRFGHEGKLIDIMACIFKGKGLSVSFYPPARLLRRLELGRENGIQFPVSFNEEMVEQLSAPIAMQQWYWFFNDEALLRKNMMNDVSVAVIRGSELYGWLVKNGVNKISAVNELAHAFHMLNNNRVDAVFADLEEVRYLSSEEAASEISLYRYNSLETYKGMFAVFPQTDAKWLELKDEFNAGLRKCKPLGATPSASDKLKMTNLAQSVYARIIGAKPLNVAVASRRSLSEAEIDYKDKAWIQAVELQSSNPDIDRVKTSGLSALVTSIKNKYSPFITEIIVTDPQGMNLAMTDITSDFWQGDEKKYQETVQALRDGAFIDDITFDASTVSYTSQVSFMLRACSTCEVLGMLTVGIDVESFLKRGAKTD